MRPLKFTKILKNNRGGGLIEAVVASGILGMVVLGSMQFNSSISKVFANQILLQDQMMLENIVEERLGYPDFCKAIFDTRFNFRSFDKKTVKIDNKKNRIAELKNLIPSKDLFVSHFETTPLKLGGDPFSGKPDGTVLEFLSSTEIHLETADSLRYKVIRKPIVFEVEKQGSRRILHGCYTQSSQLVHAQRSLCNQLGGVYSGQECSFPTFGTGKRTDFEKMVEGASTKSASKLADTLCEMDKRTTLIENKTVKSIYKKRKLLVKEIKGKGSTTKYCKVPQGSHPKSRTVYFQN